jgi:hypothetical protein
MTRWVYGSQPPVRRCESRLGVWLITRVYGWLGMRVTVHSTPPGGSQS